MLCHTFGMLESADRFESLRVVIDAEEVKGFAHAENELTRFLWDLRDDSQKINALERLKVRLRGWPSNDLSRFLLLRVDKKLSHLAKRSPRPNLDSARAA